MSGLPEDTLYPVPARLLDKAQCPEPYITSVEQYQKMHRQSIDHPDEFFGKVLSSLLNERLVLLISIGVNCTSRKMDTNKRNTSMYSFLICIVHVFLPI